VELLRKAARESFVQTRLFETLARALLEGAPEQSDVTEAIAWAKRACHATKFGDPSALDALSAAYAAQGDLEQAALYIQQAQEAAQRQGDHELAQTLGKRRAEYEERKK
jgi:hypothetical protein